MFYELSSSLCDECSRLHGALHERGMLGRRLRKRATLLRSLFRLIDLGSDQLNLLLAKLILAVSTHIHTTKTIMPKYKYTNTHSCTHARINMDKETKPIKPQTAFSLRQGLYSAKQYMHDYFIKSFQCTECNI